MERINYSLESEEIKYLCRKDKHLEKVINIIGPLEYNTHSDIYAFLVHEIVEQMLSVKAGFVIYNRLVDLCHGIITPRQMLSLSVDQIKSTGMSRKKAQCILDLSHSIVNGELDLSSLCDLSNDEVIKVLTKIRGIGPWTSKMCLIFSLNRLDIIPYEDKAFVQSYCWLYNTSDYSPFSIKKRCKKWGPYGSLAARYLYKALDSGLTKNRFHLYK